MKSVIEQVPAAGKADPREQRKEPRRRVRGTVLVIGARGEIDGELVDLSESGFRVAHADASLEPGQVVRFCHREAAGKARVIWNRIMGGRVESGFLIVERV